MNHKRKRRLPKQTEYTVDYRFWNGGIEYICSITSPVEVPKYRLKEVFDRTFVGLKETKTSVLQSYYNFKKLNPDVTYSIKTVKEICNV